MLISADYLTLTASVINRRHKSDTISTVSQHIQDTRCQNSNLHSSAESRSVQHHMRKLYSIKLLTCWPTLV